MPRKTRLSSVLTALFCLTCSFASVADEGNAQPAAPTSNVEKHPEQASDKQPTPKENTASPQPNQDDSAKPNNDPNCE
jgi:hypothetical protein